MAQGEIIQKDFSGGEMSSKVFMRDDLEAHAKSCLLMENFVPSLQGTAERAAGTQFVSDLGTVTSVEAVRIIPYMSQANQRGLLVLTPKIGATNGDAQLYADITNGFGEADNVLSQTGLTSTTPVWENFLPNGRISGPSDWTIEKYPAYKSPVDGQFIGLYNSGNQWASINRIWETDIAGETDETILTNVATIPTVTSTTLQIKYVIGTGFNFPETRTLQKLQVKIGSSAGASDLYLQEWEGTIPAEGTEINAQFSDPYIVAGNQIYLTIRCIAVYDSGAGLPYVTALASYRLQYFFIYGRVNKDINEETPITTVVPYTASELKDVHYVQSPYDVDLGEPASASKELVLVHPNHPPKRFYFNGASYVFETIPFENSTGAFTPTDWAAGNYPSCCASFHGRLMLGGAQVVKEISIPSATSSESVWGTEVGKWWLIETSDGTAQTLATASIKFTTIYRSPIQWIYGQKDLLVGAREMEYVASAEGIFQPADIGIFMQSTHGSAHVQPVGFGSNVMFAAEGGTKVRTMNFARDDDGYVAPDMTLWNPELFASGIKRMARMRNPHQMLVVLLNSGLIALLHQDAYVQISGWSRLNYSGDVHDICVVTNEQGIDELFLVIIRELDGVRNFFLEAVTDWEDSKPLDYTLSTVSGVNDPASNLIKDLDHLINEFVEVTANGVYYGRIKVGSGGTLAVADNAGNAVIVAYWSVGRPFSATLMSRPVIAGDPTAAKRYSSLNVRTRGSTRPYVGVYDAGTSLDEALYERVPDRDPTVFMANSQPIDGPTEALNADQVYDNTVVNLGSDSNQIVVVKETLPLRTEVLSISGKYTGNSL